MSIDSTTRLGLPARPVLLAPLCGVSDAPFRLICAEQGAALTYVEMLSAQALRYGGRRTYQLLHRDEREVRVGVQITSKTPEQVAEGVATLEGYPFDTLDLNMGCPVRKVVKTGGGSAILRDPDRVHRTVAAARAATDRPLSVKIRIGWDHRSVNGPEVARAAESAGAEWVTVHGRTRSDDYSVAVDLEAIAAVKAAVSIPVFGNGNLFTAGDSALMQAQTGVDGVMISRGALGNPWLFRDLTRGPAPLRIAEWRALVLRHLEIQGETYGPEGMGAICMRKHLIWYLKGWPMSRKEKERVTAAETIPEMQAIVRRFADGVAPEVVRRPPGAGAEPETRFRWDPKGDMDRQHDRGARDEYSCADAA